ncbi:MAG: hypothetical protein MMC33_006269 [Icmadophila ericetorum]|nr:hypothetical protein [Icmadophila ericetorum]
MNALRNKDFKWLLGHIGESVFDHVNHDSVYVLFEGLLFYPDLLTSLSTTELVWNVLRRYIDEASQRQPLLLTEQADPLFDGVSNARPEDVLVLAKKLILLEQGRSQSMTALLQSTSVKSLRAQYSRRAILEQLEDSFARLERSTQAEIISVLEQSNKVSPEEDSLSHLRSILKCHCEPDEMTFSMKTALTRVFSTLCESLCRSKTPEICILRMQCLDILLRKKPWVILQWHVDNLLASISTMSSSFGPSLPNRSAGEIFTSLCKLSSSLLTLHRTKLRGRFHMVVRALQGMLRCLFRPFATRLGAGDTLIQPPWLRDNDTALGENHAAAYSRILKTICDPTVSAVTRPRNRIRQELNDETKRARRIAGQHLQYLIIEFCQCQLQGTLVSGARAALNPGLYAIFDAMGQDIIKTVNSALDVQSRPIFKVTYDDYRRFGRWEGS